MDEIWMPVAGYEKQYEVSDQGRLRSIDRIINAPRGKTRMYPSTTQKLQKNKNGYVVACLCNNSKRLFVVIHKLVASAFIKNEFNKPFVNHIDGHKENNSATNLEWCTRSENMRHAYRTGLIQGRNSGESHARAVLTRDIVRQARSMFKQDIKTSDIARKLGVSHAAIYAVRKGETWKDVP